jgi:hypothetical protein
VSGKSDNALANTTTADADEADVFSGANRQDLRRKVQYARGSDADFLLDPRPYKKVGWTLPGSRYRTAELTHLQHINHAGYKRYILQRNPPRFDPDGDVVEPDDDYDDEDDLEAVEENPYAEVQIERTQTLHVVCKMARQS